MRIRILLFASVTFKMPTKVFLLITFWRYIYIALHRWKVVKTSTSFLLITPLFKGTFTSFFKDKKSYDDHRCFSYYCCLMLEGSGSGSLTLTNGSGSRRPKNIWILRIRIRNTAANTEIQYLDGVRLNLSQLPLLVQGCSRIPQLLVIRTFL